MSRLALYLLLALGISAGSILLYDHVVDSRKSEELGRLKGSLVERTREVAVAELAHDRTMKRLDSALAHVDAPIVRWKTLKEVDTLWLPGTATASDTASALRKTIAETRRAGDSVVRACSVLRSSCAAYRDTATATISSWQRRYAALDSLHQAPRPAKHWSLSASLGYGFGMRGDTLVRSPFIGLTVGRSLVRW